MGNFLRLFIVMTMLLSLAMPGADAVVATKKKAVPISKSVKRAKPAVSSRKPVKTGKPSVAARKATKRSVAARKQVRKPVKLAVHRTRVKAKKVAAKPRYAYPADIFMWSGPQYASYSLPKSVAASVAESFHAGFGGRYSPKQLVQAGVFKEEPLLGGIFRRREPLKYLIIHSTETGRPADGPRVIKSWNRGMRHPGAQYVVDRDGSIYQTVDPELATVHVNIFRTKMGVTNDNSIGIEIVRAGKQKYTRKQLNSVTKLAHYLQDRYNIADAHVLGHGQIQPSDRLDPVGFDWSAFHNSRAVLKAQALVFQRKTQSFLLAGEPPKPEVEETDSTANSYAEFKTAWEQPIRVLGNIGLLMHRLSLLLIVK